MTCPWNEKTLSIASKTHGKDTQLVWGAPYTHVIDHRGIRAILPTWNATTITVTSNEEWEELEDHLLDETVEDLVIQPPMDEGAQRLWKRICVAIGKALTSAWKRKKD